MIRASVMKGLVTEKKFGGLIQYNIVFIDTLGLVIARL